MGRSAFPIENMHHLYEKWLKKIHKQSLKQGFGLNHCIQAGLGPTSSRAQQLIAICILPAKKAFGNANKCTLDTRHLNVKAVQLKILGTLMIQ